MKNDNLNKIYEDISTNEEKKKIDQALLKIKDLEVYLRNIVIISFADKFEGSIENIKKTLNTANQSLIK